MIIQNESVDQMYLFDVVHYDMEYKKTLAMLWQLF